MAGSVGGSRGGSEWDEGSHGRQGGARIWTVAPRAMEAAVSGEVWVRSPG